MCENVSASCFDCLGKRDEKKLPLDWKRAMLNCGSRTHGTAAHFGFFDALKKEG